MTTRANQPGHPPIGVGIIGFGFMGRTHAGAYHALDPRCRLIAIADSVPPTQEVVGNIRTDGPPIDLARLEHYTDASALLADERIELVSICTPTDTHVDLAIAALDAGKHVLVEKPVAATLAEVERLAERAKRAKTLCMPAMCLRFWPEWELLRSAILERPFGNLLSLTIERLSSAPDWSADFYGDDARTGGMITDLHIHDTDFVLHAIGVPSGVQTTGNTRHLTTAYRFDGYKPQLHVTAEAAWDLPSTAGFRMAYRAIFEHAMLEHDSRDGRRMTLHQDGRTSTIEPPDFEEIDGYTGEVDALVEAIERGGKASPVTMDEAVAVMRVIDLERKSLNHEPRS